MTVAAVVPDGLTVDRERTTVHLEPGESTGLGFVFHAASQLDGMRLVTFDITVNGERWGELTECYLRGRGTYVGQQ
jgi:hypothetical protein